MFSVCWLKVLGILENVASSAIDIVCACIGSGQSAIDDVFRQVTEKNDGKIHE
ncbi:hypothetical protein DPMN_016912, partial [Dreissena polymorpha]